MLPFLLFIGYQCKDNFTTKQAAQRDPENSTADQL